MKYVLKYRHEAETDFEETKTYYGNISQTVVENFFAEFFETISFIQQEPTLSKSGTAKYGSHLCTASPTACITLSLKMKL